ncbi:uncharacterized protein LOC131604851 [Vicia villosa]|uniref:uncharacterized protein LOC131604851 n=1 Tax=Vicia villosa TaxID=3911 RepID=UPI00273B65D4|nr:uncharacterized protein LOC131604851 [Vicia villosa]
MVWNCRGAASKYFYRYCKYYLDMYSPLMVVISETRCDPNILKGSFEKLGYDGRLVVDNRGYSGGIMVAWKTTSMEVNFIRSNTQFIHLRVQTGSRQEYFFTAVYARPNENDKKLLRDELKNISINIQDPWLVAGDFNDVADSTEKRGGLQVSNSRCAIFRNRITDCNLNDLETRGCRYTWRGPIFHGGQRIYEKLDRALSNDSWRWSFPDAYVKVLAQVDFSGHHPILVVPSIEVHNMNAKSFRFENAWLLKDTYHTMLNHVWNNDHSMLHNLKNAREGIKDWKFETFDEVKRKKIEISRRLDGIQRKLQQQYNYGGMKKLEKHLQAELSIILKQEELMWFQRARTNWLADGDRNTKYYHMKVISRRKRNRILMLKNEEGYWVEDHEKLQQLVTTYFKTIFDCSNKVCPWFQTDVTYP